MRTGLFQLQAALCAALLVPLASLACTICVPYPTRTVADHLIESRAAALARENPDMPFFRKIGLHAVDTVGILHAIILRAQVLLLPVRTLVFSGGH